MQQNSITLGIGTNTFICRLIHHFRNTYISITTYDYMIYNVYLLDFSQEKV